MRAVTKLFIDKCMHTSLLKLRMRPGTPRPRQLFGSGHFKGLGSDDADASPVVNRRLQRASSGIPWDVRSEGAYSELPQSCLLRH